ncbi:hypothetical protein CBOM_06519 [Ceraceosorus bombacis]|uniref:Uncharacterized protein n=1 Tax=Ceraceosorus bombacis TaxID=401625 RepID=A0A0P1BJU4_9BASI|nr:hypothetical protein CBOM_06519 [Ceraceosorus bombacis]
MVKTKDAEASLCTSPPLPHSSGRVLLLAGPLAACCVTLVPSNLVAMSSELDDDVQI